MSHLKERTTVLGELPTAFVASGIEHSIETKRAKNLGSRATAGPICLGPPSKHEAGLASRSSHNEIHRPGSRGAPVRTDHLQRAFHECDHVQRNAQVHVQSISCTHRPKNRPPSNERDSTDASGRNPRSKPTQRRHPPYPGIEPLVEQIRLSSSTTSRSARTGIGTLSEVECAEGFSIDSPSRKDAG